MLPKNEKTFTISVVGEVTEERYEGTFTCLCVPTISMRNQISRTEIQETGDLDNLTQELFLRARWLANVTNRVTQGPDWWYGAGRGTRLLDDNVLKEVYDKCVEAEAEWRAKVKNKNSDDSQATQAPST